MSDVAGNQDGSTGADFAATAVVGERILSFVERVERIETEIAEKNEDKKEIFTEAAGKGLDVKIIREIVKIRKQDPDKRDEHDSLLDLYMTAINNAEREKH